MNELTLILIAIVIALVVAPPIIFGVVVLRALAIVARREACYDSPMTKEPDQQDHLPKSVADTRRDEVLRRMGQTPPQSRKAANKKSTTKRPAD